MNTASITTATQTPALPPVGPAWFGSVMGTGILATLLELNHDSLPFGHLIALPLLVLAWLLLLTLIIGFFVRSLRFPRFFMATVTDAKQAPAWGMVAMGLLAVGAATVGVVPAHFPPWNEAAWQVNWILWTVGTVIGLLSAFGFACMLMRSDCGDPSPAWGLPIVPPMVSATTGEALLPHTGSLDAYFWLDVVCAGCFFTALALGVAVFIVAYHHAWRRKPLPLAASPASWIPLGIVGQSTAAAQAMAMQTTRLLRPELTDTVHHMANVYGYIVLAVGVPLFLWALLTTVRGFVRKMPFTPSWWAMTFPIGTCALGTHFLGINAHPAFAWASAALTLMLCGTWMIAFFGSAGAIIRRLAV